MSEFNSRFLASQFALNGALDPVLRLALTRAIESEGGFHRARLCAGVGSAVGLEESRGRSIAAAVELFHLASLLLDDLPCMDDADTRRGRPCVHVATGESNAILASLALINKGYRNLWQAFEGSPEETRDEAASLAESCLGVEGILNGQAMDLNFADYPADEAAVARVAEEKTGSLFRLCLMLPAILGGASRYDKMHLCRLAGIWGLAYQVADDLKDVLSGEGSTGKTSRRDALLRRPNMALAIGTDAAADLLARSLKEGAAVIQALEDGDPETWICLREFHETFGRKVKPLLRAEVAA